MENIEAKIYSEVYALIQLVGREYQDMIPTKIKTNIDAKRDKEYTPVYNIDIPLEKQNISKDSLAILAIIEYNYWCKTENDKQEFIKELKQIDLENEKKLRELYNPDNIFKKSNLTLQNNNEKVALIEVKEEKWYKKVFDFLKKFFKIRK